jgi:hypothetical protein
MEHATAHNKSDPQELARAQEAWHGFTALATKATIAIAVGVVLLALITLHH